MTAVGEQIASYDVVGLPEDRELHSIVRLAAHICGTSSAMINLLDEQTQHTVAGENFALGDTPREESMCNTTLRLAEPVHVTDAALDDRFSGNPFVTGERGRVRFYAASLLQTSEGTTVGTLCVADDHPRELDTAQRAALGDLARQVVQILELRAQAARLAARNAELSRSNSELTTFAGRVAHDLRNPIAAVTGFLALARGPFGAELTGRARECVDHADSGVRRMATLVDDLLAYAGVGARPRQEPVQVSTLVDDLVRDLKALVDETGGSIELSELPTVDSDPTLLCQLLQNLISNGLKYSRPGIPPRVAVTGTGSGTEWRVSVADNGRGIPVEERGHVFELFTRLPGAHAVPGSGIGLATCARIAEAIGVTITIDDTPGGGTTFVIAAV